MEKDFGFGSAAPWSEEDQRREDLKEARKELEYLTDSERIQTRIFELEERILTLI